MKQLTILLLLLSAVVLSGCGKQITNEEFVKQCNFCKENWYYCETIWGSVAKIFVWEDPNITWVRCSLPPTN